VWIQSNVTCSEVQHELDGSFMQHRKLRRHYSQPPYSRWDLAAANSTAGNVITVIVAGPLKAVLSSTSNDVVVGSNFTSDGFTTQNSGSGKLIALAMLTNSTSVSNSGCAPPVTCIPQNIEAGWIVWSTRYLDAADRQA